jgi:hypothetical protein
MIRANNAQRAFQKRTIRPLYAWHSAVPYAAFLDTVAVGTAIVYPGNVAVKTTGEQVTVANAKATGLPGLGSDAPDYTDVPFGLFNNFVNGTMDELHGGTEVGVWVGARDAVFEVLSGFSSTETPLSTSVTWTSLNATRGGVALYAEQDTGRLTNTQPSSGIVCARLIEAVSSTKIVIQLDLKTA